MAEFNYETEVSVRFQDLDVAGHVNNAVYVTYLEEARIDYLQEVLGIDSAEALSAVVAHTEIDYRKPVRDDSHVTIALRTREPGTSSVPMEYEIRAGDEVVATAETVMVTVDYETGETRPMPDSWREQIAAFEGH
ncbi:acyl-CoA thioester hydrolase [Halovenus aranensis]|jgi:acyl-CoA thioester hydrolase|uniref:Acyl-CoA thioester hydrolase n=1 Tax=Halovenus aranensis TaxID=890420 RepID=A0A1G8WQ27_9EURY|nr:thioesterase family protein [Halovenus aranensis]SDJ79720.1 acyl-CoA thioester hydrolase [Halovenus aranensis]